MRFECRPSSEYLDEPEYHAGSSGVVAQVAMDRDWPTPDETTHVNRTGAEVRTARNASETRWIGPKTLGSYV